MKNPRLIGPGNFPSITWLVSDRAETGPLIWVHLEFILFLLILSCGRPSDSQIIFLLSAAWCIWHQKEGPCGQGTKSRPQEGKWWCKSNTIWILYVAFIYLRPSCPSPRVHWELSCRVHWEVWHFCTVQALSHMTAPFTWSFPVCLPVQIWNLVFWPSLSLLPPLKAVPTHSGTAPNLPPPPA